MQHNKVVASYTALKVEFSKPNTVTVHNNTAVNSTIGLCIKFSDHVLIQNNSFSNNEIGASFNTLQYISFQDNLLLSNEKALNLENNCSYSLVANNDFQDNDLSIYLANSWECQIRDNIVRENGVGFAITTTNNALATTNCSITTNLFELNDGYAITINSFQGHIYSRYNSIYHNSFVNNNQGGKQALDDGFENMWYVPNGLGNYWSNWWGLGAYKIEGEAKSKDNNPLENPIHEILSEVPKIKKGRVLIFVTFIPLFLVGAAFIHIQRIRRDTNLVEKEV